jgi:signal transduction histidine kinase
VADVSELELPGQALEASLAAQGNRGAMLALCDVLAQGLALSHTVFVDVRTGERQVTTHGALGVRVQARWDQPAAIEPWAAQVTHEDRFASVSDGAASLLSAELRALCPGARLGFAIPVAGDATGKATGALIGLAPRALSLHPMHRRMLEALGRQAGLSLQRAGLVEALQRTGRERQQLADALVRAHEEERGRLARELHDGAGQTLTAVAIQLDLAERRSNADARPAIAAARKQVEQTLEELRRLAHALRPAALDGLGLGEALAEMARSLQSGAAGGLEVRVEVSGALPALDPQVSTALFRVAQAALTNVVRHARATRATLRLQVGEGAAQGRAQVSLEVLDDGRGFVPGGLQRGGMGLLAMRERTVALGGRFSLWSEPGAGARVRAEFDV